MSGRIRVVGRTMVPFSERPIINNTVVSPDSFAPWRFPSGAAGFSICTMPCRAPCVTRLRSGLRGPNVPLTRRVPASSFPAKILFGRQIVFGPDHNSVTWTIVGVVGDVRGGALGADPPAMVYRCTCEGSLCIHAGFVIRTAADPKTLVRAAEEQVHAVDRDQPIFDIKTMDERRAAALTPERFQLAVIGTFAFIAILLAAAGVYGVTSYLVMRRTREIGIRAAMGARPRPTCWVWCSVKRWCWGISPPSAPDSACAWALTRFIRSMLYGVTELDAFPRSVSHPRC